MLNQGSVKKIAKNMADFGFANLRQVLVVLISKSAWNELSSRAGLDSITFFGHFFLPTPSTESGLLFYTAHTCVTPIQLEKNVPFQRYFWVERE